MIRSEFSPLAPVAGERARERGRVITGDDDTNEGARP